MKKTTNVTDKSQLYFVGGGIASLSGAVYAIRDGHIPGKNIHVFEVLDHAGGSLYGEKTSDKVYFTRGDWKFNAKTHNCLWDVLSEIPTLDDTNQSVTQEIVEFNKIHKKDAKSRLIYTNQRRDNVESMQLSLIHKIKLISLMFIPEKMIENRRIDSWFNPSFFKTNFWGVFFSMFALDYWNDLVEMKRYVRRYMHDLDKMVSGRGETVTKYNNHDSMTLPMVEWLKKQGVNFNMGCKVTDVDLKPGQNGLTVQGLHYTQKGKEKKIELKDCDFIFITNGSMIADSTRGTNTEAPLLERGKLDGAWTLWENIVKKRPDMELGNPANFNSRIEESAWMLFIVNSTDRLFFDLYEEFTGNKPGQANMVTFPDSNWHISVLVLPHPHFRNQREDLYIFGACGLKPFEKGNFVNKKMSECNGNEMVTEMCGHFGFNKDMPRIIENSTITPGMMPYEMSHFLTRKNSDRPKVVPEGSNNLAFMGQFVESDECVMLVESSVRCAQIAVYSLLNVNKEVPQVYSGVNDLRAWARILPTVFS